MLVFFYLMAMARLLFGSQYVFAILTLTGFLMSSAFAIWDVALDDEMRARPTDVGLRHLHSVVATAAAVCYNCAQFYFAYKYHSSAVVLEFVFFGKRVPKRTQRRLRTMLVLGLILNVLVVLPFTIISYLGKSVPFYVYFITESGQLCSGILLASAIFKLRRFFSSTGFRDKIN